MVVWFLAIGAVRVRAASPTHPEILKALSPDLRGRLPGRALRRSASSRWPRWSSRSPAPRRCTPTWATSAARRSRRAGCSLVFPACILSYLGQGALVLADPRRRSRSPFFLLVPDWGRLPMVLLATAATVIASQAVITGAFSVAHQAVQLGYLPRLRIEHTSAHTVGQIYVPWINWVLMVAVLILVFAFQSSAALAYAFGMAVTGTITITTLLFFYIVAHAVGQAAVAGAAAARGAFLSVELLFLAANLTKLVHGAWLPLLIGITVFTVLTTWQRGRELVTEHREHAEGSLQAFVDELHEQRPPVLRVPGTAVFLNRGKSTAPLAMRANVEHNHVLHEHVVILSSRPLRCPTWPTAERIAVDDLGYTRRRHHPRHRPLRLHGRPRRPERPPPCRRRRPGDAHRCRRCFFLLAVRGSPNELLTGDKARTRRLADSLAGAREVLRIRDNRRTATGIVALLSRSRLVILGAVLGPFVVAAGLAPFRDSLANTNAALLLVLVIVAVSVSGNRVAGVVAALSAAVWFDFFLTQPYQTFAINDRDDIETTVLLLAVGVGVTELAAWGYRQQANAQRDAGYLEGVRTAAEAVATGGSSSELIEVVSGQLIRLLGLRECRFQYGVAGLGNPARLRNDGCVELNGTVWDVGTKGLPTADDIELLVESKGQLQGRFVLKAKPDAHPSMAQRLVAVTLVDQVGASLR